MLIRPTRLLAAAGRVPDPCTPPALWCQQALSKAASPCWRVGTQSQQALHQLPLAHPYASSTLHTLADTLAGTARRSQDSCSVRRLLLLQPSGVSKTAAQGRLTLLAGWDRADRSCTSSRWPAPTPKRSAAAATLTCLTSACTCCGRFSDSYQAYSCAPVFSGCCHALLLFQCPQHLPAVDLSAAVQPI